MPKRPRPKPTVRARPTPATRSTPAAPRKRGRGRPRTGEKGLASSAYRRLMLRLPEGTHRQLDAMVRHLAAPKWQIIDTALRAYAVRLGIY